MFIFFLGGMVDAEMWAIRELLEQLNIPHFDKALSWGAKLSSYQTELNALNPKDQAVLVELEIDVTPPQNHIIINHHGWSAGCDKPSSLEQTATLLGVNLNRRQLLIAANDRGYISEMRRFGASESEVLEIRELDRQCQGVTAEEEEQAEIAANNFKSTGVLDFIDWGHRHASPLIDRLYERFQNLLLHTPIALHFTGKGWIVQRLAEKFSQCWFGGALPNEGFWGISNRELLPEVKKFLGEVMNEEISHHIFLFPFAIEPKNKNDFQKKSKNADFLTIIEEKIEEEWGKPSQFTIECDRLRYNEFAYFHRFARAALYNLAEQSDSTGKTDEISLYFEKELTGTPFMEVTVAGADKKTYRLELEHIALRIFETKIGILTIGLANREHSSPEDILHINEFFRRIYPQFLDSKEGIAETKKKFLADRIKIVWGDKPHQSCEEVLREDYFKEDKYFQLHRQIRACRYIEELLGTGFIENFNYITILDDRMFTICWYGNSWLARSLAQRIGSQYSYLRDEFWARYVFIDGTGLGCANLDFQEEAVKKVTNPRWADYGTFYGFSRYSFVCLTNTSDIARKYLRVHVRTMYYQIVVLLLAQRASILNLANRVSEISAEVKSFIVKSEEQRGEIRKILKEIRDLDADVIHFINRLWFTEITPQEQGIELYNLGQSNMALREQLKELKDEMKDLYEFAELSFQRLQVERINVLTVVGGVLLPLTLLVGFWGMNLAFLQPLFRSENLYILGSNILLSVVFFGLTLLGVTHLTSSMVKIFREDEDKYLKKEKGLCIWKLIGDAILDIWKLVWNRYSTNQKPNRGFKL